jgi:hypothetical protein
MERCTESGGGRAQSEEDEGRCTYRGGGVYNTEKGGEEGRRGGGRGREMEIGEVFANSLD